MSPFIYEAQLIGFKEGCKAGLIWLVLYSFLYLKDRKALIRPFYAGLLFSLFVSAVSFFLPYGLEVREYLNNIISTSFALFLIMSGASLLHLSGVNLFTFLQSENSVIEAPQETSLLTPSILWVMVFLSTVLFFAPDITGSMFYLRELAMMKGTDFMPYASALFGIGIAAVIFFTAVRLYRPYWIGSFFDVPQLLLLLAMVKLLGSGIKGLAELSLLPSVQRGFMKFSHDLVHQTFVFLMVPDHPLLKMTVWNFIGIFFGSNFATAISLLILLFFPLLFIYHSLIKPVPEPEAQTGAQRRKIKYLILSERRKKAVPVILYTTLILFSWFLQTGETVTKLYVPKPRPVVADRGVVLIPLKDPTMDLMDGTLHKFSLLHEGKEIRILIIRKPDNSLSVCLDACEICPPEGYGQREDQVVCIYCGTPIPVHTLGQPGGCNPIPVAAETDERFIRIRLDELLKKQGLIKPAESKETIE